MDSKTSNSQSPEKVQKFLDSVLFWLQRSPGSICLILLLVFVFSMVQRLQFLAVLSLLLFLIVIYPNSLSAFLNLVAKLTEEIRIGKVSWRPKEGIDKPAIAEPDKNAESEIEDAQLLFLKGNSLLFSQRNSEAIDKYKKAISIDEKFTDAYLNLGAAYLEEWKRTADRKYFEESILASQKALELNPEGYRSRINLAVAYSKEIETQFEALKLFDEADKMGTGKNASLRGRVKLFKANMIYTLSLQKRGEALKKRLPEAMSDLNEAYWLFQNNLSGKEREFWSNEVISLMDAIYKTYEIPTDHQ